MFVKLNKKAHLLFLMNFFNYLFVLLGDLLIVTRKIDLIISY